MGWKGNRTPSNPQEGYYVGLMNACGYRTLAECPHETRIGETYRLRVEVTGSRIRVIERGRTLLEAEDTDHPYLNGCIGCSLREGARAWFDHFTINE